MDNIWRERIRVTWLGLGHLTFGACVMTIAIANAEQSAWSLPQFAFGGAIVTQGFLHLTAAWNIHPQNAAPVVANGPDRVGIRLAPGELRDPALARDGLVLQQDRSLRRLGHIMNQDPILGRGGMLQPLVVAVDDPLVVEDIDEDDPEDGLVLQQDRSLRRLGHIMNRDPILDRGGMLQPLVVAVDDPLVVEDIDEDDPEDVNQEDPANDIVQEVDNVEQAGPLNDVIQEVDDVGQAGSANVVTQEVDVGKEGSANEVVEVDAADPVTDVIEDDNVSQVASANAIVQEADNVEQADPTNVVIQEVNLADADSVNVVQEVDNVYQSDPSNEVVQVDDRDQATTEAAHNAREDLQGVPKIVVSED